MHVRAQIRAAVVEALSGSLEEVEEKVFNARALPIDQSKWPAVLVYTNQETRAESISSDEEGIRQHSRTVEVSIQIVSQIDDGEPELIDGIAAAIEEKLTDTNLDLYSIVVDCEYATTETEQINSGETELHITTLRFNADYYVKENDPQTAII